MVILERKFRWLFHSITTFEHLKWQHYRNYSLPIISPNIYRLWKKYIQVNCKHQVWFKKTNRIFSINYFHQFNSIVDLNFHYHSTKIRLIFPIDFNRLNQTGCIWLEISLKINLELFKPFQNNFNWKFQIEIYLNKQNISQ